MGSKSKHGIECPKCVRYGYLTKEGKYYKVVHNIRVKKGEWTTKKCHLGTGNKVLQKLKLIAENRPDVVNPVLLKEIEDNLPKSFVKDSKEKLEDSKISKLITEVLELSHQLGGGWTETRKTRHGYVWNIQKCPHCDQNIQFLFMNEGNNKYIKLEKAMEELGV